MRLGNCYGHVASCLWPVAGGLKLRARMLRTGNKSRHKTQDTKPFRGQAWSIDFFNVSLILAVLLMLFLLTWNFLALRWNNIQGYNEMWIAGVVAADALATTPGQPYGWEDTLISNQSSTIGAFGLANTRNVMSNNKIEAFANISNSNYSFAKEGLGLRKYDFLLNITNTARTSSYYQLGMVPTIGNESVVFERFMILNNSIVVMRLEVWR